MTASPPDGDARILSAEPPKFLDAVEAVALLKRAAAYIDDDTDDLVLYQSETIALQDALLRLARSIEVSLPKYGAILREENAALRADRDRLTEERDRLLALVEQRALDTERLDWLNGQRDDARPSEDALPCFAWAIVEDATNLRDAIDLARSVGPTAEET